MCNLSSFSYSSMSILALVFLSLFLSPTFSVAGVLLFFFLFFFPKFFYLFWQPRLFKKKAKDKAKYKTKKQTKNKTENAHRPPLIDIVNPPLCDWVRSVNGFNLAMTSFNLFIHASFSSDVGVHKVNSESIPHTRNMFL